MKKKKEKFSYAFPNIMAKTMGKISMRAQLEASMMSQFLLMIGLTLMLILNLIVGKSGLLTKIIITFNILCGWVLISSYLVTTYQQYVSFMSAMGYDPEEEKKKIKSKGNIFKRIVKAIKNKRKKKNLLKIMNQSIKESPVPNLINDAFKNKNKFDIEKKGGINQNGQ